MPSFNFYFACGAGGAFSENCCTKCQQRTETCGDDGETDCVDLKYDSSVKYVRYCFFTDDENKQHPVSKMPNHISEQQRGRLDTIDTE